jgi:hypothetical protein
MRRRFFSDKKHHGEGVLGRFASEDSGGARPEGREPAGVSGTVLREPCLGVEDFLATAADAESQEALRQKRDVLRKEADALEQEYWKTKDSALLPRIQELRKQIESAK